MLQYDPMIFQNRWPMLMREPSGRWGRATLDCWWPCYEQEATFVPFVVETVGEPT